MSIDHRRRAARQWTAANVRADALQSGTRAKKLASWLLIVPTLFFFSFTVVAAAQSSGNSSYANAAKQLPRNQPLVLVRTKSSGDSVFDWFAQAYSSGQLCSVTRSELARISARYRTGHMTINVHGSAVDVVTVDGQGANDRELRQMLADPTVECRLVRRASIFYLPFDAHGS